MTAARTTTARDLLEPWQPGPGDPFDLPKAGHLLRRAAFGGSLAERQELCRIGVEAAVDRVCATGDGEAVEDLLDEVIALGDIDKLRAYRLWRLLRGRDRLKERMSYFWHGHFATSNDKVNDPAMMARHFSVFDRHGLGTFDELLLAVSKDPAMLRWLDNDSNVAGRPNENYAREMFELFALGRGQYTEQDIREAARAFTGWHVRDHRFHLAMLRHDAGTKTVFGKSGPFGGEDIVEMTVSRAASARFIAQKLLAFFVHPEPTDAEVEAVAAAYRERDRHVGETVRRLLRSRLFFAERAWRSRIKDPVDLVVGAVRCLGASAAPAALARGASAMGQTLCEPPSVEGWQGERAWITSATFLLRANFAADLFAGRRYGLSPAADELLAGGEGDDPEAQAQRGVEVLLDGAIGARSRAALAAFAGGDAARGPGGRAAIMHAIQTLPEAQLL